ncbi:MULTISPECIES: hypothetical protein [unclassified Streptomyces]|uniref:hypothetical protein n=1 Tax=unclassified Streptomyces TaxID=2593676 RepID=UPI002255445C|nr:MULTISPECIES: hypothetical protein [unclassified Streptomyces]MCX5060923.1 hypothetical protein [Streptomyces sp. NBC_00452]MCX5293452.1 hypothetical protein [Streptomyces sp. NBC_00183]
MSFGDPNNPYGPPQGQQPGYGYPQQQQPQAGYGYPAAPPAGPYGGPVMTTMPSSVSAARVMLWVIVGLQLLGVALFAFSAATIQAAKNGKLDNDAAFEALKNYSTGALWGFTVFALAWAVFAIVLALKFNSGGNGVRITILVFGIITAVLGIYPFIIVGLVHTVLAILVAVFVGNANGNAWFNRPRY